MDSKLNIQLISVRIAPWSSISKVKLRIPDGFLSLGLKMNHGKGYSSTVLDKLLAMEKNKLESYIKLVNSIPFMTNNPAEGLVGKLVSNSGSKAILTLLKRFPIGFGMVSTYFWSTFELPPSNLFLIIFLFFTCHFTCKHLVSYNCNMVTMLSKLVIHNQSAVEIHSGVLRISHTMLDC